MTWEQRNVSLYNVSHLKLDDYDTQIKVALMKHCKALDIYLEK